MPEQPILTVGHSNHEADHFIELLDGQGVEVLIDVRRFPGSRRIPWTKSERLEAHLEAAGIGYLHLESLGGRRRPVDDSPNGGWRVRQFQGYADHMNSEEFGEGLKALEAEAERRRVAVMCAEALWWRCHRRLIADALLLNDWRVLHLDGRGKASEHALTEFARVGDDGTLTYPD